MEHRFLDWMSLLEVFLDDPLQQLRRHVGVPNAIGVDDDYRAILANAEAGCLATLHSRGAEEEIFLLEK